MDAFVNTYVSKCYYADAGNERKENPERIIYSHWWNNKYPGTLLKKVRTAIRRQFQQN